MKKNITTPPRRTNSFIKYVSDFRPLLDIGCGQSRTMNLITEKYENKYTYKPNHAFSFHTSLFETQQYVTYIFLLDVEPMELYS